MNAWRTWLLAIGLLMLVSALGWLGSEVERDQTLPFDLGIREAIHRHASPPVTSAMILLSFVGSAYVIVPLTVGAFILLWRTGRIRQARLFAIAMAGELPIEYSLKVAFHRPRPQPYFDYALPASHSFPSGHALDAMIFFGTLAVFLGPHLHPRWGRPLVWLTAAAMIAGIGFSRVYLGVHYPTDVIAGYTAGLIWVLAIAAGNYLHSRHRQPA